ncbi:YoaK family protein [Cellulomonas sp. 179-A 9B4 NHS]|uniref:YoaK family protein n=1 Tax=Cellulomonas sp. 179-A 9B4 NHS TaxID=3142379 RepID=UPI0039A394F9
MAPVTTPRLHLVLMLALTFTTGIIDAVGYLGLDRVFTANMTGNVVILGMALAGADDLPVLGPAVALVGFMAGAALGGRVLRRSAAGWTHRSTTTFGTTGFMAVLLGVASLVAHPEEGTAWGVAVTTLLAVAMGLQAAAARRLAVKDVTTVVVTSTLTGLAADSRLAGGTGDSWARRLLAVVLILAGAGVGALLLRVGDAGVGVGMLVAGVLALVVALVGHARRERETTPAP